MSYYFVPLFAIYLLCLNLVFYTLCRRLSFARSRNGFSVRDTNSDERLPETIFTFTSTGYVLCFLSYDVIYLNDVISKKSYFYFNMYISCCAVFS